MPDMPAATSAEPTGAAPYLWCSDCRAPMRAQYYVVNERPVCPKCRPPYVRRKQRTDGRGAMLRVGLQGGLVALIGAVVLAGAITLFSPLRLLLVVPIGYLVGKQMMKALDGYSARRYQYLAVSLTYLCFLVGFAIPAGFQEKAARERHVANRPKMQGTMATQTDALRDEMAAAGMSVDATAGDDSKAAAAATAARAPLVNENVGPGPGLALVMFLLLPFIASLQFGMAFSAVGFTSIGYALYQAWMRTDGQGMYLELSGPFRVGQGPIRAQ
jgi:hypothetical protein